MCMCVKSAIRPKNGNNLELYFLRLMRHPLRQSMQPEEQYPEHHHGENENNAHDDHEHICFTGSRDEGWHMMCGSGMKGMRHGTLACERCPEAIKPGLSPSPAPSIGGT